MMLLASVPLLGDVIELRNGRSVEGAIVGQSRTDVRVRVDGRIIAVSKTTIKRIRYGPDESAKRREAEEARKRRATEERKAEDARRAAAEKQEKEKREADARAARNSGKKGAVDATGERSRSGAIWRSLVLPGWGFLYRDEPTWGWSYLAGFTGGALASAGLYRRARTAKAKYDNAAGGSLALLMGDSRPGATILLLFLDQATDNRNYRDYKTKSGRANAMLGITALLYVVQAVHVAWLDAPVRKSATAGRPQVSVTFVPGGSEGRNQGPLLELSVGTTF